MASIAIGESPWQTQGATRCPGFFRGGGPVWSKRLIAGIDLGGTRARIAVATDAGEIVATRRTNTVALAGPQALADWAAFAIRQLSETGPLRRVAIGAPGPIDPQAGVLVNPPNLPGWENAPLATLLAKALGAPVDLENDANLAGVGEYRRGAGHGCRTMVYITWSTGIGGGLILDGQLFSGAHGSAGELGHMILDPEGPLDRCGQRGCLEVFAGGHALASRTGKSAAALSAAAAAGDAAACAELAAAARYMGYGLINTANLFDPEVIVIGGGLSRSWSLVSPILNQVLACSPFIRPARRPKVLRARLGDRAGLVGALEWARSRLKTRNSTAPAAERHR